MNQLSHFWVRDLLTNRDPCQIRQFKMTSEVEALSHGHSLCIGYYQMSLPSLTFSEEHVQEIFSLNSLFPLRIGETKHIKAFLDAIEGVAERRPMVEINFEEIR